jgi:hypothetical protein
VLRVSLDSTQVSTSERVVLVGQYQGSGSRCFMRETRAITFSGGGTSSTKLGTWYVTP